jgi:omega-amidase
MSDLVVACVQTRQFWENKEANQIHFEQLLAGTDLSGIDVLVFPEMFTTGFSMDAEHLAEEMGTSNGISWLKKKAVELNCLTVASLIIQEGKAYFNRMVACFPNGEIEWYDKIHLFSLAGEDKVFTPGSRKQIIAFRNWKINLQICYDLRFPENCRNGLTSEGNADYDLLIYVANWPKRRISHWDCLVPARAVENQCYVVAVNRVGEDGNGIEYDGHSMIVNAMGETEVFYAGGKEIVFINTLSREKLEETRRIIPFLKDKK